MSKKPVSPRSANQIDFVIAARLQKRRTELHLTQAALASSVGVAFQQIQKYERGANRVAASRLFEIARVLDVPVSYFFEKEAAPRAKPRRKSAVRGHAA